MKTTNSRKRKRTGHDCSQEAQIVYENDRKKIASPSRGKQEFVHPKKVVEEARRTPHLPPDVKESEKLASVQRWIEASPTSLAPWLQVTFDKIAILKSTEFPFDEYQLTRLIGKKFKSYNSSPRSQNPYSNDLPVINCLDCYYKSNIESPLKSHVLSVLTKMSKEESYLYKSLANSNVSIHGDPKTISNMASCPIHANGPLSNYSNITSSMSINGYNGDCNKQSNGPMDLSGESSQTYQYPHSLNQNSLSQLSVTLQASNTTSIPNNYCHLPNQKRVDMGPPSRNLINSNSLQNGNLHGQSHLQNHSNGNLLNENGKADLDEMNNHQLASQIDDELNNARLYTDKDTHMIVKFFKEFFSSGSLPSLQEVRHRLSQTGLGQRRTPVSVRAKIKRLQSSGRWTDYLHM